MSFCESPLKSSEQIDSDISNKKVAGSLIEDEQISVNANSSNIKITMIESEQEDSVNGNRLIKSDCCEWGQESIQCLNDFEILENTHSQSFTFDHIQLNLPVSHSCHNNHKNENSGNFNNKLNNQD
jgi:hypothetical protein